MRGFIYLFSFLKRMWIFTRLLYSTVSRNPDHHIDKVVSLLYLNLPPRNTVICNLLKSESPDLILFHLKYIMHTVDSF